MQNPTNRELKIMLTNLIDKIEDGFELNGEQHKDLADHAKETNGNVKLNSAFRLETTAQFRVWRFLVAILGVTNIGLIFKHLI